MVVSGTFLVTGAGMAGPEVHALTLSERQRLDDALRIAARHGRTPAGAYAHAFHAPGAEYAFPVWVPGMAEHLATDYNGPHREAVRGLAACLATGTPYGGPERGEWGSGGGTPSRLTPPPRGPAGPSHAVPDPLAFSAGRR